MAELINELAGRIRLRRMELGLSQGALARSVGCLPAGIYNLEKSGDLGNWTTRATNRLRVALGLSWDQLMLDEHSASTQPVGIDLRNVGAELARSGSVHECDLPADACLGALEQIRAHVRPVGLDVVAGDGVWRLAPSQDTHPMSRRSDGSQRVRAGRLRVPEREVLASHRSGNLDVQRLSGQQAKAYATLVKTGLISMNAAA